MWRSATTTRARSSSRPATLCTKFGSRCRGSCRGRRAESSGKGPVMRLRLTPLLVVAMLDASSAWAAARPFSITRNDPALDAIIAPDAQLELLGDRFGITEGPAWVPDGRDGFLLVSDLTA